MTYRSKTLAAWLALLAGALGAHRFYLRGWRDPLAWAPWPLTLAGAAGVLRMRLLGQDDQLAWLLVPMLGLTISAGAFAAILHALTPDAAWDARHNPGQVGAATGWGAVLAAVAALFLGGIVLMGTITFSLQKFFEWQLAAPHGAAQNSSTLRP